MRLVYDLTYQEWEEFALAQGWKKFRGQQIFEWLYRKRVNSFAEMTNLSQDTRAILADNFSFEVLKKVTEQVSADATRKYLFSLSDGSLIETVLMSFEYGKTVCVTSQVGCNMGCSFCASGLLKKTRDLSSGEMIAQVLEIQKELDASDDRVGNVVIMGIGEPFDNYEATIDFMQTINHDLGLAIGARHITVSTCGISDRIRDFADLPNQFNLAISLHAPNNHLRSQLMPINKAIPLEELFDSLYYYSSKSNRRLTFEYILLAGINDTDKCVEELAQLLKGLNAYVNLIPYNTVDDYSYKSVDYQKTLAFYDKLMQANVRCTIRHRQGADIAAACGQLRANYERK